MIVTVIPHKPKPTTLAAMPVGSVGRRVRDGAVFYRTEQTATCLTDPGNTYTAAHGRNDPHQDAVELFPPGTKLEIEL